MSELRASIDREGFAVLTNVLPVSYCDAVVEQIELNCSGVTGARRLLDQAWCRDVASNLRRSPAMTDALPVDYVAVQCTLFDKSAQRNWLVAIHQDRSIPVRERISHEACSAWSVKEGVPFVQPPANLLEKLIAVRVHIDACGSDNGPLRVVPRSHRSGRLTRQQISEHRLRFGEVECVAPKGGAIILRPLLLHASSKARSNARRRVLHFLYGPRTLPFGLCWLHAV